jgi:hypothetical protein
MLLLEGRESGWIQYLIYGLLLISVYSGNVVCMRFRAGYAWRRLPKLLSSHSAQPTSDTASHGSAQCTAQRSALLSILILTREQRTQGTTGQGTAYTPTHGASFTHKIMES